MHVFNVQKLVLYLHKLLDYARAEASMRVEGRKAAVRSSTVMTSIVATVGSGVVVVAVAIVVSRTSPPGP